MNMYRFASGDPVNFSDPFGLKVCYQGSGAEIADLKKTTEAATNSAFTLDNSNCVNASSVRAGGVKSFDGLRARVRELIDSAEAFGIAFGADCESPQRS